MIARQKKRKNTKVSLFDLFPSPVAPWQDYNEQLRTVTESRKIYQKKAWHSGTMLVQIEVTSGTRSRNPKNKNKSKSGKE